MRCFRDVFSFGFARTREAVEKKISLETSRKVERVRVDTSMMPLIVWSGVSKHLEKSNA